MHGDRPVCKPGKPSQDVSKPGFKRMADSASRAIQSISRSSGNSADLEIAYRARDCPRRKRQYFRRRSWPRPAEASSAFEFAQSTFYWSMMEWKRNRDMDRFAVSASENGMRSPGGRAIA